MGIVNMNNKNQTCIDQCNKCAQACLECMKMCLDEPDAANRKKCIAKLYECACICREASSFMAVDSCHAMELCKLCAMICNECAQECGAFKDDHCAKCAAECKKCVRECQSMQ
ncbi:four-helix bundle copper-binding protein [Caproiciproducens sp. R1]|uniref:four-helix bundle copper-binding protein n=1 Tax=Caproiciproducens sp. R1 TaxID=3435000 RepID=UPI004033FA03